MGPAFRLAQQHVHLIGDRQFQVMVASAKGNMNANANMFFASFGLAN